MKKEEQCLYNFRFPLETILFGGLDISGLKITRPRRWLRKFHSLRFAIGQLFRMIHIDQLQRLWSLQPTILLCLRRFDELENRFIHNLDGQTAICCSLCYCEFPLFRRIELRKCMCFQDSHTFDFCGDLFIYFVSDRSTNLTWFQK